MGAGAAVLSALKIVGGWVAKNPSAVIDGVAKIQANKISISNDERLQIVDEKLEQLGAATLELNQKIDYEVGDIRDQIRTLKNALTAMGIALSVAVVAIILLLIF